MSPRIEISIESIGTYPSLCRYAAQTYPFPVLEVGRYEQ